MRLVGFARRIADNPVESIGLVLALGLTLIGLYLASPIYVVSPAGTLAAVFDNEAVRLVIAAGYLLAAAPFFVSLFSNANTHRFQRLSTFWMFIAYLFITFLRLLTSGYRPFTWVLSLALALIAAIIHLWINRRLNA